MERGGYCFFRERFHDGVAGFVGMQAVGGDFFLEHLLIVDHGGVVIEIDEPVFRAVIF